MGRFDYYVLVTQLNSTPVYSEHKSWLQSGCNLHKPNASILNKKFGPKEIQQTGFAVLTLNEWKMVLKI
jgi:hypothetical protein